MTQKEFEEWSERKVQELNKGDEKCREAWRDGFITAMLSVQKKFDYADDAFDALDSIMEVSDVYELSAFNDGDE